MYYEYLTLIHITHTHTHAHIHTHTHTYTHTYTHDVCHTFYVGSILYGTNMHVEHAHIMLVFPLQFITSIFHIPLYFYSKSLICVYAISYVKLSALQSSMSLIIHAFINILIHLYRYIYIYIYISILIDCLCY